MFIIDADFSMDAMLEVRNAHSTQITRSYSRDTDGIGCSFFTETASHRDSFGVYFDDETVHGTRSVTESKDAMVERMLIAFREGREFHYQCNLDCFGFENRIEQEPLHDLEYFVNIYGDRDTLVSAIMNIGDAFGEPDYVVFLKTADCVRMLHFVTSDMFCGLGLEVKRDCIFDADIDLAYSAIAYTNGNLHVHYLPF